MKIIFVATMFFLPIAAMANGVGNGGFLIQCSGSKPQLFDYYQAEQSGLHIALPTGSNLYDKVESLLLRLQSVDPNRSQNYKSQYIRMTQERLPIEGLHLTASQVADPYLQLQFGLGAVTIPSNCELILAAQQLQPSVAIDQDGFVRLSVPNVQFISSVWDQLDLDTQAALIVHELFYEEFLLRKITPQNSVSIRKLNGILGSSNFGSYDKNRWMAELRSNQFSPMFPDFTITWSRNKPPSEGIDVPFSPMLTTSNDDYTTRAEIIVTGPLKICSHDLMITSNASVFLMGEIPLAELTSMVKDTDVDLSCYTNGADLALNLLANAPLHMDKIAGANGVQNIGLKDLGTVRDGRSFLKKYSNPNLKILGNPKAAINFNTITQSMNLTLERTEFSDIQALTNGTWDHASNCVFDLANGALLTINH